MTSDYAESFGGKYFKLMRDLDMNFLEFAPIGTRNYSIFFSGNFDGNNHTIANLVYYIDGMLTDRYGLFSAVRAATIKNLNLCYQYNSIFDGSTARYIGYSDDNYHGHYSGILACWSTNTTIENVNIYLDNACINAMPGNFGYLVNYADNTTITNCRVFGKMADLFNSDSVGGFVGSMTNGSVLTGCLLDVVNNSYGGYSDPTGLLVGSDDGSCTIKNNLVMAPCEMWSKSSDNFGLLTTSGSSVYENNVFLGKVTVKTANIPNGILGTTTANYKNIAVNRDVVKVDGSAITGDADYLYTSSEMKERSTYANWEDFDTYWVLESKYNSGYPMLKAFKGEYAAPYFDVGAGTESSPYLISTQQDLLNINAYYADNPNSADVYFKLANNIDMSKDSNNFPIHFTPIGYNRTFDGYFDGNGKTISGLLIDNQYEYTGLFGTIASNHWVKDLTVKGDIYWDEAYAVGGVAGRVLAGGYLQNCHFEGNIIGVLNTKTSTETNGVVGKFEINGAIDCTATYTDIKYAKIGGTADNPTYTYYLYDWAQIKTYLYDKKVD